jgi:twitching motility protein PilT
VGEADLALTIAGVRCRLNLFRQQGGWSAAIRLLNEHIPDLSELGLPKVVSDFPAYSQGLVLITGETGSGKSTTLAAILNQINRQEAKHILTLEDPIEYIYTPDRCVINQREVGKDTQSFAAGLRAALREDPDVILVGEMRDLETIETALTAAETGHLVFGTVHTNSAADSIDRMVDVFPAQRQQQIRLQLSMTLKAVLSQQLLPRAGGGRVLACEVMKVDGAIRNLIREGKTPQIANAIQTTGAAGNILMDRCLQNLRTAGVISEETFRAALRDQSQAAAPANGARGTGLKRPL